MHQKRSHKWLSSWARLYKFFQLDCSLVCPECQHGMQLLSAGLGKRNLSIQAQRRLPEVEIRKHSQKEDKRSLGTGYTISVRRVGCILHHGAESRSCLVRLLSQSPVHVSERVLVILCSQASILASTVQLPRPP